MKLLIDVPDGLIEPLIFRAIKSGLCRVEPRRAWTGRERREFVKSGLVHLLNEEHSKQETR